MDANGNIDFKITLEEFEALACSLVYAESFLHKMPPGSIDRRNAKGLIRIAESAINRQKRVNTTFEKTVRTEYHNNTPQ